MNYLTIGEIAEVFGHTKGAIRFYEEKGLITPKRNESGYRIYTTEDFFQLLYLKKYAEMGITLEGIRDNIIEQNQSTLGEFVNNLKRQEVNNITEANRLIQRSLAIKEKYEGFEKYIEDNNFYEILDLKGHYYIGQSFFKQSNKDKRIILKEWLSDIIYINIANLFTSCGDNIEKLGLYLSMSEEHILNRNISIPSEAMYLQGGKYYHVIFSNTGKSFAIDNSDVVKDHIDFIRSKGWEPKGISSVSIAFSHIKDGEETKYYDVYIPIC